MGRPARDPIRPLFALQSVAGAPDRSSVRNVPATESERPEESVDLHSNLDENPSFPLLRRRDHLDRRLIWSFGRPVIGAAVSRMIGQAEADEVDYVLFQGLHDATRGGRVHFPRLIALVHAGNRYFLL